MNNRRGVNPRAHGFVMLIALVLGIWLKNTYDDKSNLESDIELYKISNSNKDTTIMNLSFMVDSLKKIKPDTIKILVERPRPKPIVKDTIVSIDSTSVGNN